MCLDEEATAAAIARARSLEEIEAWLNAQPRVRSVHLAPYLLKSNPPQRNFIVELEMKDRSITQKIVNLFDKGDRFEFHKLRDQELS